MTSEQTPSQGPPTRVAGLAGRLRAPVLVQFIKFGIVGISNTLLTFAVYTRAAEGVRRLVPGWPRRSASSSGPRTASCSTANGPSRTTSGDSLTPVRWAIVQGCGLGINELLLYLFVDSAHLDKLLAQAFATAFVTVSTFFVNRAWTFRTASSSLSA